MMEGQRILIIEDDRDTASFFQVVLELVGFECEVVLSARDAFIALAAYVPDLIMLDMRLGLEIGGQDILFQIRSNPRFDRTRVVVVTAYPHMAKHVTELADLVLLKPVDVDQIKTLLERLARMEIKPKYLQFRDPVTELFNEEFLSTRLELAFERARRRGDFIYGVIVLQFHSPQMEQLQNDDLLVVDVLRTIVRRLRENLRPTDTIARLTGWKFAILNEDLSQAADLDIILKRLKTRLVQPVEIGPTALHPVVQVGTAFYRPDFRSPGEVLKKAEEAAHGSEAIRLGDSQSAPVD
jgi:diguanylate cyclase (GGDEF)-like protein